MGAPLRLQAAAVEALPLNNRVFGWVAVPTLVLRPVTESLNTLFGNVRVVDLAPTADADDTWMATAVGQ